MKKLTLNHLAFSGLRANRKEYRQMAVGVFLAVFFTVGTLLGLDILFQRSEAETAAKYGREDALYFSAEAAPEDLISEGLAKQAGAVTLVGTLRNFPVGCYDDTARTLLSRRCLEGRLPMEAGEAAMDRKVLERLFRNARIGDTLVLPITDGSGQTRQKEYRLVGVLQSQFQGESGTFLEKYMLKGALSLPEVLLGSQEDFAPICRHIVFTFPLGGNLENCKKSYPNGSFLGIDSAGQFYTGKPYYSPLRALKERVSMGLTLMLAGSALLLASLLGIFSAVSGQFYRKEEQYRMLRTVGATRRQIRAISSREAVLLTLLTAPAGSICALGFVELLRCVFPGNLPCPPRLRWVLAGLVVSCGLVWLAARLPGLLYRPQRTKGLPRLPIRSRREYRLPKLWNRRSLRFHPFRMVCETALMFLFFFSAFLFARDNLPFSFPAQSDPTEMDLQSTYIGWDSSSYLGKDSAYFTVESLDHLTPDILPQLKAMPGVESVSGSWCSTAIVLSSSSDQTSLLQEQLQTDLEPFKIRLVVLTDFSKLESHWASGSLNLEAINNGTAVLVDIPPQYKYIQEWDIPQVSTGDTLSLVQLCIQEGTYDPFFASGDPENYPFAQAEKHAASPAVCGVSNYGYYGFSVITTPQGLQHLGLSCDRTKCISVKLSPDATEAESKALRDTLERLSFLENDLEIIDSTENLKINQGSYLRQFLFWGALAAMLFLLATMQLQGDLRRRIRSKKRAIGILRAVGCDEGTLLSTYRNQIIVSASTGSALTLLVYLSTFSPSYFLYSNRYEPALYWIVPFLICSTALVVAVNTLLLKKDLHRLMQNSVIENIREE